MSFQENNADMLAAGSAVRGAQGVIYEKEKNTLKCLSDVPTEKLLVTADLKLNS